MMAANATHFTRDQLGWVLLSVAAFLLAAMAFWAVPQSQRSSFLFQATIALLLTGAGLAIGLQRVRNR